MKPRLPHICVESIVERDYAHAHMVRHVRTDDRLSRTRGRARVVDCVPETVRAKRAL